MKHSALKVLLVASVLVPVAVYAQPRPGNPTTATVITKEELAKINATEQNQQTRDENAKVVDIGDKWSRAGTGASAHSAGYENHIGAL